jgi:glycerophosphoryl diester phosphodiesterase
VIDSGTGAARAGRPPYPYLEDDGPLAFAHRGGIAATDLDAGGENTMAAFERAVRLGFRYLETDVHATSDGVLLAFHDTALDRLTGERGRLRERTAGDLEALRVHGRDAIPRLADVLVAFPDARLNVDVKHESAIGPLLDVLRTSRAWDRVCVAAFSDRRVRAVREAAGPRLATALGPREVAVVRAAALAPAGALRERLDARLRRIPAACAQVPVRLGPLRVVDQRFVAAAHRVGLPVHAWVVDDPDEIARLLDLGVDGIMSDDLEALLGVLAGRRRS